MAKKTNSVDLTSVAKDALAAEKVAFGPFIDRVDEGEDTFSYLFKSELKGYVDWHWSVTIYQPAKSEPTVSELVLLPGETSLVAPDWVPWSERLADYKALQAELELQAALEAEDEDVEDLEDSEDVEEDDLEDAAEELLAAESEVSDEPESDSNEAGVRPPRSRSRNRGGKNKKDAKDD